MRVKATMTIAGLAALAAHPLLAQDPGAEPAWGEERLAAGFTPDPHTVTWTEFRRLENFQEASVPLRLGGCKSGIVALAPDVDLDYSTNGGTDLYVYVTTDRDDSTLLINLPDGTWLCDDDGFGGTNPLVMIGNAAGGLYHIWIGSKSEQYSNATLNISEIDPR